MATTVCADWHVGAPESTSHKGRQQTLRDVGIGRYLINESKSLMHHLKNKE